MFFKNIDNAVGCQIQEWNPIFNENPFFKWKSDIYEFIIILKLLRECKTKCWIIAGSLIANWIIDMPFLSLEYVLSFSVYKCTIKHPTY